MAPRQIMPGAVRRRQLLGALTVVALAAAGGCAGALDGRAVAQWRQAAANRDSAAQVVGPADRGPAAGLAGPATLAQLVDHALEHHPALAAAFASWQAAVEGIGPARSLPDPQVSFALVYDEIERDPQAMGERYGLAQMFPWFGKRQARGDVAAARALAAGRRYEAARAAVARDVVRAHTEHAYLEQALATVRENRELLARVEAVARSLYRTGSASQADVLRAQIELGRLDEDLRSLADRRATSLVELKSALGWPATAELLLAAEPPAERSWLVLPELDDGRWLALARDLNPDLAVLRHEAASRDATVGLARKESGPDFMIALEYARDGSARPAMMDGGGADMLMGMISFNLPVRRGRIAAGVREAQAARDEALHRLEDETNRLAAAVQRALFDRRDGRRKQELYGGTLVPRARQALAAYEAAYRVGDAGFADLIDAQRVLLEFSLAHDRAVADGLLASARLTALLGQVPGRAWALPAETGETR